MAEDKLSAPLQRWRSREWVYWNSQYARRERLGGDAALLKVPGPEEEKCSCSFKCEMENSLVLQYSTTSLGTQGAYYCHGKLLLLLVTVCQYREPDLVCSVLVAFCNFPKPFPSKSIFVTPSSHSWVTPEFDLLVELSLQFCCEANTLYRVPWRMGRL